MAETKKQHPVRKRRLKNLNDCVRAGAWLWNEIARDQIDLTKAGKLSYLLNVQKSICQAVEQGKELKELLERMEKIESELRK